MRTIMIAAILALTVASTDAAPMTYACRLVDGAGQPGMYGDVDQVVIDTENPLIELRVANTMGTVAEVNWIFTTRIGYDGFQETMAMTQSSSGAIIASGSDAGGSYSFKFDRGYLLFGATYMAPALAFTWQCQE